MRAVVIIFLIVATIFALATLAYVVIDLILELLFRKKDKVEEQEPEVVEEPEVNPEPEVQEEVMPEIVESVVAEEADAMISDALAMKGVRYECPAGVGMVGIINIGDINDAFEVNDVVTLSALKEKRMVPKKLGRLKVLADGELKKPLTIKAEGYSVQAIKMIELTGGTVIILRD